MISLLFPTYTIAMSRDLKMISDYWRTNYSVKIPKYKSYEVTQQFKQMARFFAMGKSYYYVVNFYNLQLEYISDSVRGFMSKEKDLLTLEDLLKTALPEELPHIQQKEKVISDFYLRFLDKEDILSYKLLYSYQLMDPEGNIRTMMHQSIPLRVNEDGMPEHVFCVHTDISHLKVTSTTDVSFINLNEGPCYYNIRTDSGKFDPQLSNNRESTLKELLSKREKEIVEELAKGLNAQDIAMSLNLSPHTVKTHRKNILQKSGCSNTTQLVAKCLTGGVISTQMVI